MTFNLLSALTVFFGGLVTCIASVTIDVAFLVPYAGGNFVYIAASDLVPEVNRRRRASSNVTHLLAFALGVGLLLALRMALGG